MRNALVVLVVSCIGLSSGFIVPSGLLELLNKTEAVITDNTVRELEDHKRKVLPADTGFIVLPYKTKESKIADLETKQNRIKNEELYEQNTGEENNVNERSFIYINQKYKTPVLSQLHKSIDLFQDTFKSLINEDKNFNKFPGRYPLAYNEAYFTTKIQQKEPGLSLYFPTLHNNGQDVSHKVINKEYIRAPIQAIAKKVVDVPREYVELLKPPYVRPIIRHENMRWQNNEIKYNTHKNQDNNYKTVNKDLYTPGYPKDPSLYKPNSKLSSFPEHYIFPSLFEQRSNSAFDKRKPEGSNTITNSNIKKLFNDNNEMSKLLERYLKDSFEKQVINDRYKVNTNCNYEDCIMKPRNQYINSPANNVNCRCGRRMNLHLRESNNFEANTTTFKDVIENRSTDKSSEVNEYADLLNEEAKLKSLLDE